MKRHHYSIVAATALALAISLGLTFFLSPRLQQTPNELSYGKVIYETASEFSRIRVRERDGIRNLFFIEESGVEQRQSAIDLKAPHELQLGYSKSLFVSLLFRHPQERILIAGLGGGGMVRFLNHALPDTHVDVVEIDPVVVKIAADYFGTAPGPRTTIHTQDAFVFLRESHGPYDAIYMDAFLHPPADAGMDELTPRLKTVNFLKDIQARLKPGGLVAFNLIEPDPSTKSDLMAIREAFPSVYLFSVPGTGNLVVIASLDVEMRSAGELSRIAAALEQQLPIGLPFQDFVRELRP